MRQQLLTRSLLNRMVLMGQISALLFGFFSTVPNRVYAGKNYTINNEKGPVKVTGKVTDEKDMPIAGVSITAKNTRKGVSTDAMGRFTIDANEGGILIFSFTGYVSQEVSISS